MTTKQFARICVIIKLENELNKNMAEYGTSAIITLSDATRLIRKTPELNAFFQEAVQKLK
jgi:hypothetical protein